MEDRYLSTQSVQEKFDVTRQTLWNWEKEGLIEPGKTPGGQRRYSESALKELLGLEDRPTEESVRLRGVAEDVAEQLNEQYGDVIDEITLYGSVARGDAHEESDIDLVVLVSDRDPGTRSLRRKFHRTIADLKAREGVSLSIQVFGREEWSDMTDHPYHREVESEDGVKLVEKAA